MQKIKHTQVTPNYLPTAPSLKTKKKCTLTEVDKVYLNYGQKDQKPIDQIDVETAKRYLETGHFPQGSMGPKIKAVINYLENGGNRAIITNAENIEQALQGKGGTHII